MMRSHIGRCGGALSRVATSVLDVILHLNVIIHASLFTFRANEEGGPNRGRSDHVHPPEASRGPTVRSPQGTPERRLAVLRGRRGGAARGGSDLSDRGKPETRRTRVERAKGLETLSARLCRHERSHRPSGVLGPESRASGPLPADRPLRRHPVRPWPARADRIHRWGGRSRTTLKYHLEIRTPLHRGSLWHGVCSRRAS